MDEENKRDGSKEFGKVIDALHNKSKLSSLRTYQGDMAEFIKSKDESVISIAVKEKERKEKKIEEAENLKPAQRPASKRGDFQMNLTMLLLSVLLIGGGVLASLYIFEFIKMEPVNEVAVKEEIIPYNNSIVLANITNQNLRSELGKISTSSGVSVLKISNANGLSFQKVRDFFGFLKISLPAALERTLKDEYMVGIISQNNENSYFFVITVDDFGRAFSAMLDWEGNMVRDLSFLNPEMNTATSTGVFVWRDIIVKNKDTRAFANEKNRAQIAYTFLDKNTILIVSNLLAIGDISSAYASRLIAR